MAQTRSGTGRSRSAAQRKDSRRRRLTGLAVLAAALGVVLVIAAVTVAFGDEPDAAAPATTAPAPENLRVVPKIEALVVRWSTPSVVGIQGFRVRWRALSESTWSKPVERPASATSYKITGLAAEPYEVKVRAILGEGALSPAASGVGTPLPGEEEEEVEGGNGAVVGRAPVGPPTPASGWHVAYADAFGAPLGSGPNQDNTMRSNEKWNGCCTNSDEVAVEKHAQAFVGTEGLEEICSVGVYTVEGHTRAAACGGVRSDAFFEFTPATAGEWAVECYVRMPVDLGGADPGCWTYPNDSGEIDFFELWGWNGASWATANGGMPVLVGQGAHELAPVTSLGFNPAAGFHRYTTAFVPEGTGRYDVREYIDGAFRWHLPGRTLSSSSGALILTNGLRVLVQPDVFTVRSIALWQDSAHAGHGIRGGGVAPGTTLGP